MGAETMGFLLRYPAPKNEELSSHQVTQGVPVPGHLRAQTPIPTSPWFSTEAFVKWEAEYCS